MKLSNMLKRIEVASRRKDYSSEGLREEHDLKFKSRKLYENNVVDPHFSRAPPLDWRDSLLFCEKLIFRKVGVATYFIFYFRGKIKQERKTLKSNSIIFGKIVSLKNSSLSPRIRLLIGKVPLGGSTPLSPIKVSTD